jgi:hypothetical protein
MSDQVLWKDDWQDTKSRFQDWWHGRGFIVGSWPAVKTSEPHADVPDPGPPESLEQQWADLDWRCARAHYDAAHKAWPLETLPVEDPWLGPGSMALYLGCSADLRENTIWYEPCIEEPGSFGEIRLDPANRWWQFQLALIERMIASSGGHYYVGAPDMVENWDVLASMRGAQVLLMDMLDRPSWVRRKLEEVHEAWIEAYSHIYDLVTAQDGQSMFNWFRTYAPGKVSKVQCDGSAMFSPNMFGEFVVPTLTEQCEWLDYSLFHLDGSACVCHLDSLLEIEALTAIEWTPDPKVPQGGSLHWVDMYRRILGAGKSLQVLGAGPDDIEPLLDAIGTDGVYFLSFFDTEQRAEEFERVAERLR